MSTIIKNISLSFSMIMLCMSIISCGNKSSKAADEHEHGEEAHVEGEQTIASLTAEQIKSVGIQLGEIANKNLTSNIKANGFLRVPNNNRANPSSLYAGLVKTLNVQLGDYVRKGQVIANLQNPQFVQLQEDYLNSVNELQLAELELERQKELNAGNAGTKRNLQNASSQVNILRTKRASLQQQLQLLGVNPHQLSAGNLRSNIVVVSPISGVVSNVFVKIGTYVDVSTALLEVVDNNLLHLDLQVFERDLPKIKIGQSITFNLTNNPEKTYSAKVSRIGASFENDSKSVAVHCLVIGDKNGLIDGMNITGTISLSDVSTAAVPNEAIVESKGKYFIFAQTDKEAEAELEDHDHEGHSHGTETAAEHDHEHEGEHQHEEGHEHTEANASINFEKIEVIKGVSNQGYTAITPVQEIPKGSKIVVKGAFFINAKLTGTVGHSH